MALFQATNQRHIKSSTILTTNVGIAGWTRTFTDLRLCAAIIDRLTFAGNILETGTTSYRLAHARGTRAG